MQQLNASGERLRNSTHTAHRVERCDTGARLGVQSGSTSKGLVDDPTAARGERTVRRLVQRMVLPPVTANGAFARWENLSVVVVHVKINH